MTVIIITVHRAKRKAAFIGGAVALLLLIVVIDLVVSAAMKPKDQSGISYQISRLFPLLFYITLNFFRRWRNVSCSLKNWWQTT